MTQEEKQLLLKDLCARLPYGVICKLSAKGANVSITEKLDTGGLEHFIFGTMEVLPYLRPLSSMTEEEFHNSPIYGNEVMHSYKIDKDGFYFLRIETYDNEVLDWLNAHHFDYRRLIEKGLALEAPKGMYKIE